MKAGWAIEPHICGACFGRILSASGEGGRVFRCSNCGNTGEAVGPKAGSICSCRTRIGKRDAGVRCVPNAAPSHEFPSEIVAKETA